MRAGELRHRAEIQEERATEQNDHGEYQPESWVTFLTRWAAVEPISATESEFARRFAATVSHKVRLRHTEGILPVHRVKFGDRTFAINGVLNDRERDRETHLFCTETVATETNE